MCVAGFQVPRRHSLTPGHEVRGELNQVGGRTVEKIPQLSAPEDLAGVDEIWSVGQCSIVAPLTYRLARKAGNDRRASVFGLMATSKGNSLAIHKTPDSSDGIVQRCG